MQTEDLVSVPLQFECVGSPCTREALMAYGLALYRVLPQVHTVKIGKGASGGSPYQLFQNQELANAKRLAGAADLAPSGNLTAEALARVREGCRQRWAAMNEDERALRNDIYKQRLSQRRLEAAQGRPGNEEPHTSVEPASHWGFGG